MNSYLSFWKRAFDFNGIIICNISVYLYHWDVYAAYCWAGIT